MQSGFSYHHSKCNDFGKATSNLIVTKSCTLMPHFALDLSASFNTLDDSLLNTLPMTSLSSGFPPPPLAALRISSPLPNCCMLDFCMLSSVLPRTHLGTSALSSGSHPCQFIPHSKPPHVHSRQPRVSCTPPLNLHSS